MAGRSVTEIRWTVASDASRSSPRRAAANASSDPSVPIRIRTSAIAGPGSVLVLDDEVGAADGSGQLRLLPRELEPRELLGNLHPLGELESDRPLRGVVDRVHHVDR